MQRLKSLDILRGLTVMLMILVNNGGKENYSALEHSQWNGLTPCDLVFPFFLFMVGMSTYLSLKKFNFEPSKPVLQKIAKRTILLFLIGLAINWFDMICQGEGLNFAHLRIWGVMQRIALCYGVVATLAVSLRHRYLLPAIITLLLCYLAILLLGNGYAYDASINIIAQADIHLFGANHLYTKSPVDPEGLLSTMPAIAHTLIGFWCCKHIQANGKNIQQRVTFLKLSGFAFMLLALSLSLFGFYPNKRIWSPTFVLATCGLAAWVLGLLIQYIDRPSPQASAPSTDSWLSKLCLSFGMNPLFLYVMSEALAIVFGAFHIKETILHLIQTGIGDACLSSLIYALLFVAIHAAMAIWMFRKRIFIKI